MTYQIQYNYGIEIDGNKMTIRRNTITFDQLFAETISKVPGVKRCHSPNRYRLLVFIEALQVRSVQESVCEAIDNELDKRLEESAALFKRPKAKPTHSATTFLDDNTPVEVYVQQSNFVEEYEWWGRTIRQQETEQDYCYTLSESGEELPEIGEEILDTPLEFNPLF